MPRPIIQDSDDDTSDNSPLKAQFPAPSHDSQSANEPTPTETVATSHEAVSTRDEPTAPSISPITTSNPSDGFSSEHGSPTTTNVKRCRTTMDEVGSYKPKLRNIYGNKTTLDDLSLSSHAISREWSRDEDEVDLVPDRKKRRREGTSPLQSQHLAVTYALGTEESPPGTNTSAVNEVSGQTDLVNMPLQQASGSVSLSQVVDTAIEDLKVVRNHMSIEDEATAEHVDNWEEPCEDTSRGNVDIIGDDPGSSSHGHLEQTSEPKSSQMSQNKVSVTEEGINYLGDKNETTADATSLAAPGNTSQPSLKETHSAISQTHELGSDEHEIDTPMENYKPRPSRSRRGDLPDAFLASIDFSKRPEKAAKRKSKLKRNKTTNDIPTPVLDDDEQDELLATDWGAMQKGSAAPLDPQLDELADKDHEQRNLSDLVRTEKHPEPTKRKRGRPRKDAKKDEDQTQPAAIVIDTAAQASEPKKRGRKKKVVEEITVDAEEVHDDEDGSDEAEECETDEEEEIRGGGRKRSRLQIHTDTENGEATSAPTVEPGESVFKEKKESLSAGKTLDTPKGYRAQDEPPPSSQQQRQLDPTAAWISDIAAKTPEKPRDEKRPNRHSPLSSGRVPHRVGLSRKARIEPLLRIIRK
ncbi:MAG: hypothetical protein MMC23_002068 [Stictis urceolatum]|nr:hypothetical protein [Stictis urceolata]